MTTPVPPSADRVAIAQDALEQLRGGTLTAFNNIYLHVEEKPRHPNGNLKTTSELTPAEFRQAECLVCGRGALLLGFIGTAKPREQAVGSINNLWSELEGVWGRSQLALVEACFEGWETDRFAAGPRYEARYRSAGARLTAILENIIRNGGTFIPKQDLTEETA